MRALRNLMAAFASILRIAPLPPVAVPSHPARGLSIMDGAEPQRACRRKGTNKPRHVQKSRKARAFAKSQRQKLIWR